MKEMGPYRSSAQRIEDRSNWFVRLVKRLRCKHSWRILNITNKIGFTPDRYYSVECIKCDKKKVKSFSFWSAEYEEFITRNMSEQEKKEYYDRKKEAQEIFPRLVNDSTEVSDQVNRSTLLM